jgi:branched-chain amino acid transport system ATP-binding protein
VSAILEATDLTLSRGGRRVLDKVSLRLEAGKTTALLGPNGAGKSSFVLALAGVLPIESGSIELDGTKLHELEPYRVRRLGLAAVPEGHQVLTRLTVEENLTVAASIHGAASVASHLDRGFELFPELASIRRRIAGALSGGEAQMLALAQAVVARPKFLLADELSLGLAPIIVQRLMAAISRMAEEGIGILLIEQFTSMALRLADSVYVLDRGQMRFHGVPAELKAQPKLLQETYLAAEIVSAQRDVQRGEA